MTRRSLLEMALWAGAVTFAGITGAAVTPTPGDSAPALDSPAAPAVAADSIDADSLASAVDYVATHDPFRTTHQPSSVAFGTAVQQAGAPAPRPARPPLALRGIIGVAPRWRAILVGVPAHDGDVLVETGDTLGGLRVRSITSSMIIIQGADTTWHLVLRAPWQ